MRVNGKHIAKGSQSYNNTGESSQSPTSFIIHSLVILGAPTFGGVPITRFFLGWAFLVAASACLLSSSNRAVISSERHSWQWIQKVLHVSPASSSSDIILGVISFHFSRSDSKTLLLLSYFCGDIKKETWLWIVYSYMYTWSYPY